MRIITSIERKAQQVAMAALALSAAMPRLAFAQGFDKINTTVTNINTILVTISIAVVTIAIIWAGFKMIFQGARLADVANVLIGGTLVGGAADATLRVALVTTHLPLAAVPAAITRNAATTESGRRAK